MIRHSLKAKWVGRYDPSNRLLRVGRIMWQRGTVGDGQGYSAKLSIGLRPTLFRWHRETNGWLLTAAGVRVHLVRAYGGIFA